MCVQITAGVLWTKSKKDDKDLGRERNKKLDKVMVFKAKKVLALDRLVLAMSCLIVILNVL